MAGCSFLQSTSESTATDGESKDEDHTDTELSSDGQTTKENEPSSAPSQMSAIVEESLRRNKSDDRLSLGGGGGEPTVGKRERRESELSSQSEEGGAEGGADLYPSSLPSRSKPIGIPLNVSVW